MLVFWLVTPNGLVSEYQCFGGMYCLSTTSALKMKALCSSEVLVTTHKSTQCYNPEDRHWHLHCCENLESHRHFYFYCLCMYIFVHTFTVVLAYRWSSAYFLSTFWSGRSFRLVSAPSQGLWHRHYTVWEAPSNKTACWKPYSWLFCHCS
jgi:hypothetical protein